MKIEQLNLIGASFRTCTQDFRDVLESRVGVIEGPVAVLATCNRVEAYFWRDGRLRSQSLLEWLSTELDQPEPALRERLYLRAGVEAAHHLMRVAGGLDSLVVGEDQILGQVGAAIRESRLATTGGFELGELFRQAVRAGRRIHAGHRLAQDTSIAEASIHWLAGRQPGGLRDATVTLIGAGKMARSAAATLVDSGVARLLLLNRSVEHAESVAAQLGHRSPVEPHPLSDLTSALCESAVVVGATRSPQPVVTLEHVAKARAGNGHNDLVLLDLATPRDFDPEVREIPGVTLIDLDDLGVVLGDLIEPDRDAVSQAEEVALEGAESYARWLRIREASPSVVAYRRKARGLLISENELLARHLASMTPAQRDAVERSMRRLASRLMHAPTLALRRAASEGVLPEVAALLDVPSVSPVDDTDPLD